MPIDYEDKLFQGKSALLIDDDHSFLTLVRGLTKGIVTTDLPETAKRLLLEGEYSMLITDTNMPEMNGIELLQWVRAEPKLKGLPVVVLFSGLNGSDMTIREVYRQGATLVTTKEFFVLEMSLLFGKDR
ncbi:MAG: response regulator [Bdellovibrionota bacterium]